MGRWRLDEYMFKPSSRSTVIREVKQFLQSYPCLKCNLPRDDVFDVPMQSALAEFQKQQRLRVQDGSFNFETYAAIGKQMPELRREHATFGNVRFHMLLAGMPEEDFYTCRLNALKKMAQELGAKADDYETTADKVQDVGVGVAIGVIGAAITGTGVGGVLILGGLGVAGGTYNFSVKEYRIERGIVNRFWKAEARCIAIQDEINKQGSSMSAAPDRSKNFFVVTRQFGTFALFPYYKFLVNKIGRDNRGKEVVVPKYIIISPSPNRNPYR